MSSGDRLEKLAVIEKLIATESIAVVDDFLEQSEVALLAAEALEFRSQGRFSAAGVGKGSHHSTRPEIRGDEIMWFEKRPFASNSISPAQAEPAAQFSGFGPGQQILWDRLEELKTHLNQSLFLGLQQLEGHFAFYQTGSFYAKHLDRFQTDDTRVLSCVLYLNAGWKTGNGGELKIYPPANTGISEVARENALTSASVPLPVMVEPIAGRLVCFLSDRIPHEVLPTHVPRLSFAGWFRRRALST